MKQWHVCALLILSLAAELTYAGGIIPSWMRRDKGQSTPPPQPEVVIEKSDPVVLRPPVVSDLSVDLDPSGRELIVSGRVQDDKQIDTVFVNGDRVRLRGKEFVYRSTPTDGNNSFTIRAIDSDDLVTESSVSFFVAGNPANVSDPQQVSDDVQPPVIEIAETSEVGSKVVRIKARVIDNVKVAEVLMDGLPPDSIDGDVFTWERFIPATGLSASIVAYDVKGLQTLERFTYQRSAIADAGSRLQAADPFTAKPLQSNPNRVALIIGVEGYKSAAEAKYAINDANMFQNYAEIVLGVPARNIKLLTNEQATRGEILLALKAWLPTVTQRDQSELFIFYAGHGMPTADGSSAYLVPFDANVQLLEDTGISRTRLYSEIKAVAPKSATFFFDNCYGGTNRDDQLLLASRPLSIKVEESPVPANFLVFNAGESDQTAGVLDEVKHGRFSYFLFKGLEGEADLDGNGKISAGELQGFVRDGVSRYSAGSQTPTMLGNTERLVLN